MTDTPQPGDRIAKVMARAGVASRRDAERLIVEGRVAVNGQTVTSPALDVLPSDKVTLDGKPIDAPQPARLWLYYKPLGLVTSEHDEKGRQTVFESLPDGMPRVMSVGRLDLNSEGLLLLTNDGGLKRRLELPSTGWLRKYRVRVNGRPNDATFDPLRRGITIEGEDFLPMDIHLDRQQGANAWLTVGLREGKNREIRRAMAEVGLTVNRLIRVSYGPFRLNEMKPGDVIEVKQKVLKEQLGAREDRPDRPARAPARRSPGAGGGPRFGDRPDRGPKGPRSGEARGDDRRAKSFEPRAAGPDEAGERPARKPRMGKKPEGAQAYGKGPGGPRPDRSDRPYGRADRTGQGSAPRGPRKPYAEGRDDAARRTQDGPAKPKRRDWQDGKDAPGGGDRKARPAWKDRPAANDRPPRSHDGQAKPKRRDWQDSKDGSGGADRKGRPAWKDRPPAKDRAPRDDRPDRPERSERRPRADGPGGPGGRPQYDGARPKRPTDGNPRPGRPGPKGARGDSAGGGKPRPARGPGDRPKGPPRGGKGEPRKK